MTIQLLHLKNTPIFEQLKLEEALLRVDDASYCIINEGSPSSIVMGISSKPEEVLFLEEAKEKKVPLIRRYSGGGCVIVDEKTIFVSFIFAKKDLSIPFYPESILRWTEGFYQKAFRFSDFQIKENDYVIHNKKCGGNAQYLKKERCVHHTTFLWDFDSRQMQLLKFPPKVPSYRLERSHDDFLIRMKEFFVDKDRIVKGIAIELQNRFKVCKVALQDLLPLQEQPHRKSVTLL